jgi:predicted nucleotidyltransferase component of viral defense system
VNLFERLVEQALSANPALMSVRAVIEKELLHHDILREMSASGLLSGMTFIGGTCLRACYGSPRLSEDLDFTGGKDFSRQSLASLAGVLTAKLEKKYSLKVQVTEPVKETAGVDTWKMTVLTHPGRKDLPLQCIHIDICAVPSHLSQPMMLRNIYGVDMGTSGLILRAQSREEILADKMVALAFRPNRMKNRDLWDIFWLKQQGIEMPVALIPVKIADHRRNTTDFVSLIKTRMADVEKDPAVRKAFISELRRFLPSQVLGDTVEKEDFWVYLANLIREEGMRAIAASTPSLLTQKA